MKLLNHGFLVAKLKSPYAHGQKIEKRNELELFGSVKQRAYRIAKIG
jgi:hypothetical protein